MKLKCIDGVTRRFHIPEMISYKSEYSESWCEECGKEFGIHDTRILKPKFKQHICKTKEK